MEALVYGGGVSVDQVEVLADLHHQKVFVGSRSGVFADQMNHEASASSAAPEDDGAGSTPRLPVSEAVWCSDGLSEETDRWVLGHAEAEGIADELSTRIPLGAD